MFKLASIILATIVFLASCEKDYLEDDQPLNPEQGIIEGWGTPQETIITGGKDSANIIVDVTVWDDTMVREVKM